MPASPGFPSIFCASPGFGTAKKLGLQQHLLKSKLSFFRRKGLEKKQKAIKDQLLRVLEHHSWQKVPKRKLLSQFHKSASS